jgi:hypothetical protein
MTTISPNKASILWLRMEKPETDCSRLFIIEISLLSLITTALVVIRCVVFLVVFLDLFAGNTTGYDATHRSQRITFTATNLAAYQAASCRAYRRTGYLMTVFGLVLNLHVMANLVSLRMHYPGTGHRQHSNEYQACRHVCVHEHHLQVCLG